MKLSLSTNWCSRRTPDGEAIAEKALELGFEELELGYALDESQIAGIRRRLDAIAVGSVHAFCPAPISAPHAHPELYRLADFDESVVNLALLHLTKSIETAADVGADTVVLHAGKVHFRGLFDRLDSQRLKTALLSAGGDRRSVRYMKTLSLALKRREKRGLALLEKFKSALDAAIPALEKNSVTLALENMPYLEGFPNEGETASLLGEFSGAPVKAWFDTGHHLVRVNHGWTRGKFPFPVRMTAGMHLNDVKDLSDDHLAPGDGNVDFAALSDAAKCAAHAVFEPSASVSEDSLRRAVRHIRGLWGLTRCR